MSEATLVSKTSVIELYDYSDVLIVKFNRTDCTDVYTFHLDGSRHLTATLAEAVSCIDFVQAGN